MKLRNWQTHKPTKKLNYRQYKRADCTHFGTLAFEWAWNVGIISKRLSNVQQPLQTSQGRFNCKSDMQTVYYRITLYITSGHTFLCLIWSLIKHMHIIHLFLSQEAIIKNPVDVLCSFYLYIYLYIFAAYLSRLSILVAVLLLFFFSSLL